MTIPGGYHYIPHLNEAADESATTVRSDQTHLMGIEISNLNAQDLFIQLFNASSPTVGTSTPVQSYLIPQGNGINAHGALDMVFENGIRFTTAMSYAITTTPSGSTGPDTAITVNLLIV